MSRPPRLRTHTGHTGLTPSLNRRVCLVSAERQIQLLLRCQVAVVHVDHQILNKNRLAGSDMSFSKQQWERIRHVKNQELCKSWCLYFHHGHLMSSQQHCLSSKFCSCSKARPNKPMLRPEQQLRIFSRPHQNPDLPMIRTTNHVSGPLPGRLTNQSCKVRKCVLEPNQSGKNWAESSVRNC